MTDTILLVGLLGVGTAAGILLILLGLRRHDGPPPASASRWRAWWQSLGQRTSGRVLVAAIGAGILAGVATGWVVGAVLVALAVWALPKVWGGDREHADRVARLEGIAVWTEMLRDTLSAAAGLEQALLATASSVPDAIRPDVQQLAARLDRGDKLAPTLRALADDLADPTADLVISALVLAAEHQARDLAQLLGELAGEAREQVSMRLRIEAGRTRTRTSVRVIVGTTVVFAVGLVTFNREYLAAFDSATGQVMLPAVGALFGISFAWLSRIARAETAERFLTNVSAIGHRASEGAS
jgi:tight adherence protein B